MKNRNSKGQFTKGHILNPRKGTIIKCSICNKSFYKKPHEANRQFCSYKCYWKRLEGQIPWNKNQKEMHCNFCNKSIYRPNCLIKKNNFCSYDCYWKFKKGKPLSEKRKQALIGKHSGSKHWNWKGGRLQNKDGYVSVYCPIHKFADKHGYIREHRLVMEKHLNRLLKPSEVVHHINKIRNDNKIENLMLFKNKSEHRRHHSKESHY